MTISRRKFIKIGSVSAALIAGTSLGIEAAVFGQTVDSGGVNLPPEVYGDPLFSYQAETFRKLVGTEFSLQTEDFAETVVLTEMMESPAVSRKVLRGKQIESKEDFMLSFRVSSAEAKQSTYTMVHPELGKFDLLLVPANNNKGENLLNAVINRL
jgi:hypothetical protein